MSTGLVFQFPRVPSKSNSYLFSTSYNILFVSLLKCLLSDTILLKSDFLYFASNILRVHRVALSVCSLSHHSPSLKLESSRRSEGYFMETVHFSYAPPFPIMICSEKHKSNWSFENKSQPMIITYHQFFCESST